MASPRRTKAAPANGGPVDSTAGATVHLLGGGRLDVRQGPAAVAKRLAGSIGSSEVCALLADINGNKVFVNPRMVTFVGRASDGATNSKKQGDRSASARLTFADGTALDVVQSPAVVSQRLEEAQGKSESLAPCALPGAQPAFVNHVTVAAVTALTG